VTYFPFDDQICHLKFGSWSYSGLQVDLSNRSNEADLSNYIPSGEWEMKRIETKRNVKIYSCCPDEPYPDVRFYIHIRRRVLYFLTNIIFPCLLLSAISVMTFWLPPDSGEKITLSITVLLAFSVFMLLIAENIPSTSEMVPLIGGYIASVMLLTSTSIVLTIFILELHHSNQYASEVPKRLFTFLTKRLAPRIGLRHVVAQFERAQSHAMVQSQMSSDELDDKYDEKKAVTRHLLANNEDSRTTSATETNNSCRANKRLESKRELALHQDNIMRIKNDWKLVTQIVDRTLFWIFLVATFLSSFGLLVAVPLLKYNNYIRAEQINDSFF
jgi:nicotinic acetylcholine receptor